MEITGTSTNTTAPATSATANVKEDVSKDAFMRLLVSQIQHQDPLNPTDGVQFLSQLAQFSQLEQMLGIRSDLAAIIQNTGEPASAGIGEGQ